MQLTKKKVEVVIITGASGAGKTTAINVLEDAGYESIDNIPIELMGKLLSGANLTRPLALGIDIRTRGFSAENLLNAISRQQRNKDLAINLVYLDCHILELEKRFNGTRRRHPLSEGYTLRSALKRENEAIEPLKGNSNLILDTSLLNPNQLKAQLIRSLNLELQNFMSILVQSFSYKKPIPGSIDMLIDCRFLNNPHWDIELRQLTGQNSAVGQFIEKDKNWTIFFGKTIDLLEFLIPLYKQSGKTYLAIGFGCSGGQHRSVYAAEKIVEQLQKNDWIITLDHRELKTTGSRKVK